MWHTVLNDPQSYPEASATAMFVYGLLKLERLGAFPFKVRPMALKAWKALNENYVKDGRGDRCFGRNGDSQSGDFYRKVPVAARPGARGRTSWRAAKRAIAKRGSRRILRIGLKMAETH